MIVQRAGDRVPNARMVWSSPHLINLNGQTTDMSTGKESQDV